MKGTDLENQSSASGGKPISPATVELVGFNPTLKIEGAVEPSALDAAAYAARRRKRRVLLTWAVALTVIFSVVLPRAYRQAKTDRASSLARSAEAEARDGQIDLAVATVRSAYLMAPSDSEVLRAMAQILSALNAPSAMTYWNWVLASPSATEQDRRRAAESALKLGSYNQAGTIIKSLLNHDDHSAPNLLMAARYYALGGAPGRALGFASLATQSDPAYKPAAIFLAVQELDNPALRQAGIDSLLKIARAGDEFGFLALERLAQEPSLKPEENRAALDALQPYSSSNPTRKIVELILQVKLDPAHRENLIKQAVAAQSGASPGALAQFGAWLNSAGESKWVPVLIPQEKILKSKDLFVIYLDALGAEKKWDDMDTLLTQGQLPLETAYTELYLFRCSEELGDTESADLHWRGAEVAASHSPRESLYIAGYVEKLGESARAEPIYLKLTHDQMAGRPAYLGLVRIYQTSDTGKLRDLLDQMTTRWSDDEAVANDDIYYNLLLNSRVPQMHERAVSLAKANIYSAPHLTDLALSDLRLHQAVQALHVFETANIHWETASSATRTVYAATLKANGRAEEAARALAPVDRSTLRPEEMALIADIP